MATYIEEDLRQCRKKLARDLNRVDVPDAVWGRLVELGLPFDAIREGYAGDDWEQLIDATRKLIEEEREASPTTTLPTVARYRGTPEVVDTELDDYTKLRAGVFSEVAGALANRWKEVRGFRDTYLGGIDARLTDAEAGAWLFGGEAPEHALDDLRRVSRRLSRAFRWRKGDADWFVLTGSAPFVRPVGVEVRLSSHLEPESPAFMMDVAEIVVTAEPWVDSRILSRVVAAVQRQVNGGDNRKRSAKALLAVQFVARRLGTGEVSWQALADDLRRTHPRLSYKNRNGLYQAFHRFLRPGYSEPKYRGYEPTPWQRAERAHSQAEAEHIGKLADNYPIISVRPYDEGP